MIAPVVRIGLRYASGILIARGMFGSEYAAFFADPAVESAVVTIAGVTIGAATEYTYVLARRYGWNK